MENRERKKGGPCPYVGNPLEECYVAGMNSQNIEQAIHYCGANYEECDIYQRAYRMNQHPMKGRNIDY